MPEWLKLTTAFFFPFFTALATSWTTTDHVSSFIVSLAAGFGGLAGFGTNQKIKSVIQKRSNRNG